MESKREKNDRVESKIWINKVEVELGITLESENKEN